MAASLARLLGLRVANAAASPAPLAPLRARAPALFALSPAPRRVFSDSEAPPPKLSMADAKQLLGLDGAGGAGGGTLTASGVKEAYRRQANILHPDKNPNSTDAGAAFKELKKGYEVALAAAKHHDALNEKKDAMASWKGDMRRRKSGGKK